MTVVNHKDSVVLRHHLDNSDFPGRKQRTFQLPSAQWHLTPLEDKDKDSLQKKMKNRHPFIPALSHPKRTKLAS